MRLGHLTRDTGINGRELSRRCGILGAKAASCDADIRAWCTACSAGQQAADLVATARAVDSMYMEAVSVIVHAKDRLTFAEGVPPPKQRQAPVVAGEAVFGPPNWAQSDARCAGRPAVALGQ